MFTGIIEEIGKIKSISPASGGLKIVISAKLILNDLKIDDSVSINGVCQTAVKVSPDSFEVTAVEETIKKTTFGLLKNGEEVNLERALTLSTRLGGHIVQGHADTTGIVKRINKLGTGIEVWIDFPKEYEKNIVNSGSIAVEGVSLTVAEVKNNSFKLSLIPHSWDNTTLKKLKIGSKVNLEFDILGKYIEKLYSSNNTSVKNKSLLERFIDQPEF